MFPRSLDEQHQPDRSHASQVELPTVSPIVGKQTAEINHLIETLQKMGSK